MNLKTWILIPFLALALYANTYASDIFIGRRGPTNWQVDQRVVWSKSDKENETTNTTTNTTLFKYWDGDERGKFFMIQVPYKSITTTQTLAEKDSINRLGDISLCAGPRGRSNNFHWFLYGGLTLPTGAELGNQRTDINLGGFFTQMSKDQKYEIDGSFEYKITGQNKNGTNSPDEFSAGLLYGRELSKTTRIATGLAYFGKENGVYSLNWRSVIRYTPSNQNRLHFEAMYETPVNNNGIPRTTTFGLFTRYNF